MIIRIRLPSCPLFEGIAPEALLEELARLQAAERKYKAGETLLAAGSPTSRMGLVLEGELHAILPLPQGRQLLQSRLLRGGFWTVAGTGWRTGKPRDRNCPHPLPRAVDPDEEPPGRWRNAFFRTASEQSMPSAKQRLFLLTAAAHLPNTAYSAGTLTVLPADGMLYPGESHRSSAL